MTMEKAELLGPLEASALSANDILAEPCYVADGCQGWHERVVVAACCDGATVVAVLLDDMGVREAKRWAPDVTVRVVGPRRKPPR